MEINKRRKYQIIGVSLCSLVLAGSVYAALNMSTNDEKPAITKKSDPLNPTERKKTEPVLPDSNKKSTGENVTKSFKPTTESSDFNDFRSAAVVSYGNERNQALNLLNNQIEEEKNRTTKQESDNQEVPKVPESSSDLPATGPTTPVSPPITPPDQGGEIPVEPEIPIWIDYNGLVDLINQALQVDKSLYLTATLDQLATELTISLQMIEDRNSSQLEVDNQVERLRAAINQLVLKGDKTSLQSLYDEANALLTDIYTNETVQVFEEAMKSSEELLGLTEITQAAVDQMFSRLQAAIEQLTEKEEPFLSLAYLQRLVSEAEAINLADYTSTTVQNLQLVLAEVISYIEAETYTVEENQMKMETLQQAIDQLVQKADKTSLILLLEQAQMIDLSIYTSESSAALESAILAVEAAVQNDDLEQEENDQLLQLLQAAIDQLVEKELIPDSEEVE